MPGAALCHSFDSPSGAGSWGQGVVTHHIEFPVPGSLRRTLFIRRSDGSPLSPQSLGAAASALGHSGK